MNSAKQYKQVMSKGKAKKGGDMDKDFGKSSKPKEGSKKGNGKKLPTE